MGNGRKNLFRAMSALTIGTLFVFIIWTANAVFTGNAAQIYAENGLMENVQAIILSIACLFFLFPVAFGKREDKLVLAFCSLLCYTFVLRELDVEHLDIHCALKFFGSGAGRDMTLAAGFIAIFFRAAFRAAHYKNVAVRFLHSKCGMLLMTGGVFLLLGHLAEKFENLTHHVYFEELLEVFGYAFMLLSAFVANSCATCSMISFSASADEEPDH